MLAAAAICASLCAAAANATGPAEAAGDSAPQLEEVVVTSAKRKQDLQQVPLSITALSANTIQDAGIKEFSDYAQRVPNLTYSSGFGVIAGRTVAIRGVQGSGSAAYFDQQPAHRRRGSHGAFLGEI